MITCHQCKLPVENGSKFCAACGTSISVDAQAETAKAGAEPQSSVAQHPAMMQSRGMGALVPILIAAAIGIPLLAIGGFVVAIKAGLLESNNPTKQESVQVTPTENAPAPKEEIPDSLKKEIKKLEDEKEAIEKQIKKAKDQLDSNNEEIRKAESRIQNMLSIQKKLETWQKASLVVGSQKQGAIAFTTGANKGELVFLDKVDAEMAAPAILASARRGAQWYATNDSIVQRLETSFEFGKPLSTELSEQIATRLVRQKVLSEPAVQSAPYVTYRMKTETRPRFARYCGKTDSAIRVQHIGSKESLVKADQIALGSARLVGADEVKDLDDGEFLDAALLGAIAKLQESVGNQPYTIPPKLAIDVQLTNGRLTERSGGYVLGKLCQSNTSTTDLARAGYLLQTDLYQRLVGIEKLDPGFSVAAPDNTRDFLESAIVAKALLAMFFSWNESHSAAAITAKSGVKDWDMYMDERAMSDTTHLLQVEVGPPAQDGEYFLNIQLHDLRKETVLFAVAGDRYFRARSNLHYPASGKLALLKKKSGMLDADAAQEPEGLWRGSLFKTNEKSSNAVVIGESLSVGSFNYRTLLGTRMRYESTKDIEVEPITGDYNKKVPMPDRIRLAAHQLVSSVLPPSSLVSSVTEGDVATIKMGLKAGLKVGDRLAVARSMALPNGEALTSELGIPVIVNEVAESTSKVSFVRTGLEELFPRNKLEPGDTVYAQSRSMPIVVIQPFQFSGPSDQEVAAKIRWNVPARRTRVTTQANDATRMLHEKMGVALRALHVPSIDYTRYNPNNPNAIVESAETYGTFLPPNAKVTRLVKGKVTILSDDDCQFEFFVYEPTANQNIARFPVTLKVGRE